MADDFDWSAAKDDLVVEWQGAIAVYRNSTNGIVIRQQLDTDEDQFVVIQPKYLPALVKKLRAVAAEIKADE